MLFLEVTYDRRGNRGPHRSILRGTYGTPTSLWEQAAQQGTQAPPGSQACTFFRCHVQIQGNENARYSERHRAPRGGWPLSRVLRDNTKGEEVMALTREAAVHDPCRANGPWSAWPTRVMPVEDGIRL
jgi:hypothetical protein